MRAASRARYGRAFALAALRAELRDTVAKCHWIDAAGVASATARPEGWRRRRRAPEGSQAGRMARARRLRAQTKKAARFPEPPFFVSELF